MQQYTYVDDLLSSYATVEEAVKVTTDAIQICSDMSFELVGLQSNDQEFLKSMPQQNIKERLVSLVPEAFSTYSTKVLGMHWTAADDEFVFKAAADELATRILKGHDPTKRELLSVFMQAFDPLGLISKYLIEGKIIIQEVWREGTGWDDPISTRLAQRWREFQKVFQEVETLRIPRQYAPVDPIGRVQLITFCDASPQAYAAVVYVRFIQEGRITWHLQWQRQEWHQ